MYLPFKLVYLVTAARDSPESDTGSLTRADSGKLAGSSMMKRATVICPSFLAY
jgi:hypothetical protein